MFLIDRNELLIICTSLWYWSQGCSEYWVMWKITSYILPYLDLRKVDQEHLSNYIYKHSSLFSWGPVKPSNSCVSSSDFVVGEHQSQTKNEQWFCLKKALVLWIVLLLQGLTVLSLWFILACFKLTVILLVGSLMSRTRLGNAEMEMARSSWPSMIPSGIQVKSCRDYFQVC